MSNYDFKLDSVFLSLSDVTRRDIIKRIAFKEYNIGELAQHYNMSLNAVSKHIKILERASLIIRKRKGRFQYIQLAPRPFKNAMQYLEFYKNFWEDKLDSLGKYLEKEE